jgi:hypothetical protein
MTPQNHPLDFLKTHNTATVSAMFCTTARLWLMNSLENPSLARRSCRTLQLLAV